MEVQREEKYEYEQQRGDRAPSGQAHEKKQETEHGQVIEL
jgi:hypothetical protein